jgi:hypothetical protein
MMISVAFGCLNMSHARSQKKVRGSGIVKDLNEQSSISNVSGVP